MSVIKLRRSFMLLFGLAILLASTLSAGAATGGSISFTGTGDAAAPTCDEVDLDYHFAWTGTVDDGGGDWVAVVTTDGAGRALDVDFWLEGLGPQSIDDYTDIGIINSITMRPVNISLYDIPNPGSLDENSLQGYAFATAGTLLAVDSFDPAIVAAACAGLPLAAGGCDVMMPIPATAVGGTFVADAPTYWAPGEPTNPLVTIKAGNTARVIGKDASGQYYKIIWVCDFLWVPVNTMGPNYDSVWNGAPLPTEVVQ